MTRRKLLRQAAGLSALTSSLKLVGTARAQTKRSPAVNKNSAQSDLKITDMRACMVTAAEPTPDRMVPFRWPSSWTDPKLVELFAGGPINCLILEDIDTTSSGIRAVTETARKVGLAVRAWRTLRAAPLSDMKLDPSSGVVALTGLVWPSIQTQDRNTNGQSAGPTGPPWIDSNCWVVRLARARAPGRQIWLDFAPPRDIQLTDAAYRVAIADSAAASAHWILTLDRALSRELAAAAPAAVKTWRSMLGTLSFFERHRGWRAREPWGPLGILSTFSGDNELMGREVLNLAGRRNLLYRVLDRSGRASPSFDGLRTVLYVDQDPPPAELKSKLTEFIKGGGLVVLPRALASAFPGDNPRTGPVAGYELHTLGKGSIAVATRDWGDPYYLAVDVHSLASRREDPVLLFNGSSLFAHYSMTAGTPAALLQLVSFTGRPNDSVTVLVSRRFRSARMYVADSDDAPVLRPVAAERGVEFRLPPFSVYTALELEQ